MLNIVNAEMLRLSELTEEQFHSFKTNQFELKKANTVIANSAKDILAKVGDTNVSISQQIEALQKNVQSILKITQETNAGLENVMELSKLQQDSTNVFSLKAKQGLDQLVGLDRIVIDKLRSTCADGKESISYWGSEILYKMQQSGCAALQAAAPPVRSPLGMWRFVMGAKDGDGCRG